jgi:hypothetical protein
METLVDILGWAGSVVIVLTYGLNSYQKLRSDSMVFYMLNLAGGVLLIVYALEKDALANAFINVVWVIIALVAIGKRFLKKSNA